MVLRTLKDCSFLRHIPLNDKLMIPNTEKEWNDLELEVAQSLDLNGIELNGETLTKKGFVVLELLQFLCNKLLQDLTQSLDNGQMQVSPSELYKALLVRLSPSKSAETTYSEINNLVGSNDLALQVPKKAVNSVPKMSVVLYVADDVIHAVIDQYHAYGLFRKSDTASRPWIGLTACLHERVNFSSGESARSVSVQVHENKYPITF